MTGELLLGVESSCDETAAAVVRGGREVLSSVIHSQAAEHALYGGVVPEIAGRSHLRVILPTIDGALEQAGVGLDDLAGIAVTYRPGLVGSLLVGLSAAKAIAFARDLPLVGVHHIEAHVYAATMGAEPGAVRFPCVALVASGGHTALYLARGPLDMDLLATTRDDAAGEAFDKVAHLLGTAYPGGPSVAALAEQGERDAIAFPRYRPKDGGLGFSFSGVKTSVLYHLRGGDALAPTPAPEDIPRRADVAASFQEAVVDALVETTLRAARAEGVDQVLVAGGVACNQRLRELMHERATQEGVRAFFPAPEWCTDNAVMIAGLGWHRLRAGAPDGLDLDASPR
jgi:tRNA N6-adenosine threonylcarbamoyltransferase